MFQGENGSRFCIETRFDLKVRGYLDGSFEINGMIILQGDVLGRGRFKPEGGLTRREV